MDTDICCLGELLVDFVGTGGDAFHFCPGGAPANVAVGAARLGLRSALITCVGSDPFGDQLLAEIEREGVDISGAQRAATAFTTLAFVRIAEGGERSFFFARSPGADTRLDEQYIPAGLVEGARVLHFGSLSLTHELCYRATMEAIRRARAAGRLVSMDVNYRDTLWSSPHAAVKTIRTALPFVDILKVSEEEARLLTGLEDESAAALQLLDTGAKVALVTLGADGCLWASGGVVERLRAMPAKVVDTNGAGDSFMAAFLGALLWRAEGGAIERVGVESLRADCSFAVAAASITVTRSGAIPALPTRSEVERALGR